MAPKAPATERRLGRIALVLGAHGIRGGVGVAAEHAERIAARGLFAEVRAGALKGEPGLVETVRAVRAPEIVLAPLLMAEGYTLRAMRRRLDREMPGADRLTVCRPVGVHPGLGEIIRTKALSLCAARSWPPAETALLIVGHGTERHPDSGTSARWHGAKIAAQGTFAKVTVAFLDEAPRVPEALGSLTSMQCVAVGLFIDAGEHGEEDIPALLAPAGDRAVYAGPLGPDPLVTGLILDQVQAVLGTSIAA